MIFVLLALVLLALFFFWKSGQERRSSGLPKGRVIYQDPELWGKPEKPFFDVETRLTGKPDYLVAQDGLVIPVEVKSGYAPLEPYASHVYQLLAYCLLVERETGNRPPYGILRHRNRSFAIDYGDAEEQELLDLLAEMRADERAGELDRSHEESARCARCGFRSVCDRRL